MFRFVVHGRLHSGRLFEQLPCGGDSGRRAGAIVVRIQVSRCVPKTVTCANGARGAPAGAGAGVAAQPALVTGLAADPRGMPPRSSKGIFGLLYIENNVPIVEDFTHRHIGYSKLSRWITFLRRPRRRSCTSLSRAALQDCVRICRLHRGRCCWPRFERDGRVGLHRVMVYRVQI